MTWSESLRGFYAVLDRDDRGLAEALLEVASVLQVRMKGAAPAELLAVAAWARELTQKRGSLLVVNDDIEIALAVGADAVHLGQGDLPLAAARGRAGRALRIGISTHSAADVSAAVAGGADYLGFGPVFATSTKAAPDPVVGLEGLRAAVALAAVPIVAIGGITASRARAVWETGAAAACAIGAVNGASNPAAAARAIAAPWG